MKTDQAKSNSVKEVIEAYSKPAIEIIEMIVEGIC